MHTVLVFRKSKSYLYKMSLQNHSLLISIEQKMCVINGQKVLADNDLAELLNVSSVQLKAKVRANPDRFPDDFAFILSNVQYITFFKKEAYKQSRIYVFTLMGIMQAANLFNTKRAVDISIQLIEYVAANVDVFKWLEIVNEKKF